MPPGDAMTDPPVPPAPTVRRALTANADQRTARAGGSSAREEEPPVWVEARDEAALPAAVTRLGREKVRFLVESVGPLPREAVTLELFGGSGLSTAVIAGHLSARRPLVTLDLHQALSGRAAWRYVAEANWPALAAEPAHNCRRTPPVRGPASPLFLAADAADLPLADGAFDAVVLTDAPRTAVDRFAPAGPGAGPARAAGRETTLSAAGQADLFRRAVAEGRRVLRPGGMLLATAPRSWTAGLEAAGWDRVLRIVHERPADDGVRDAPLTVRPLAARHRFRVEGATDPVVYLRAVRSGPPRPRGERGWG